MGRCEMDPAALGQGHVMCSYSKIAGFAYYEKKALSLKQAVSENCSAHSLECLYITHWCVP
jgi:hypothetical protein